MRKLKIPKIEYVQVKDKYSEEKLDKAFFILFDEMVRQYKEEGVENNFTKMLKRIGLL